MIEAAVIDTKKRASKMNGQKSKGNVDGEYSQEKEKKDL